MKTGLQAGKRRVSGSQPANACHRLAGCSQVAPLIGRLREPRRFLQVVAGPRQAAKTKLVKRAMHMAP